MTSYVAFLRGINVGGSKVIKMADLKSLFDSLKFEDVKTYIQSGNVFFESSEKDASRLEKKIHAQILKHMKHDVVVFVRTRAELEQMVARDPFKGIKFNENEKACVTFLGKTPAQKVELPFISKRNDLEILSLHGRALYSFYRVLQGRAGSVNAWWETNYKSPATTRNWEMLKKMLASTT